MEFERRKLSRQAEKLERKLKKKGESSLPRSPESPRAGDSRTTHYRCHLPAGEASLVGGDRRRTKEEGGAQAEPQWIAPGELSASRRLTSSIRWTRLDGARPITTNCARSRASL